MSQSWTCSHFSLANPRTDRPDDLPLLLRRLADEIDQRAIAMADVLDVVLAAEATADGPWWTATVYWSTEPTAPLSLVT